MSNPAPRSQLRSRLTLLLIAVMFFSSFGIAAVLFFSGWTGGKGRNHGELLAPPRDVSGLALRTAQGQPYPWAPEKNVWRMVVLPPAGCAAECTRLLDALHRVWFSQGRKADRIDVLWFGPLPPGAQPFRRLHAMQPDPRLTAALPVAASAGRVPVYLVDPGGFVAVLYHPGFDPNGLRKDLGKLIK